MIPALDSQFRATTPDDLRLVISQTITADPNLLKDYLSQIVVTTSDELSVGGHEDQSVRSFFDPKTRVFTLLADRVSVGEEARVFAEEITRWFGAEVAGDLVGDELVTKPPSLIEGIAALNCSASFRNGLVTLEDGTSFSLVNVASALHAVANVSANSNSEPDVMGKALEGCSSAAQIALDELNAAVNQGVSPSQHQNNNDGSGNVVTHALSVEFLSGLSSVVGESGVLEIGWRNLNEPHSDICHSHDFCDANQVMLHAFERVFQRAASLSDSDSRFINDAWVMAKVALADSARSQARSDLPIAPDDFRESLHVSARPVFSQADGGFVIPGLPDLGSFPRSDEDALHALATSRGIQLSVDAGTSFARRPLEAGDKVFVRTEQRLATVLNVYGDGVNGSHGDVRLDLCGNTSVADLEHYDSEKHSAFDHTFIPIRAEWKRTYGITKDVPLLEDVVLLQLRGALEEATRLGLLDDLAAYVHPDVINDFCDAVGKLEPQGPAPAKSEYVSAPDVF